MKHVWTIVKKEFSRFFKDKRMVLTILLPGILIYLLYSIMGGAMADMGAVDKDYKFTAYVVNMPDGLNAVFAQTFELKTEENLDAAKAEISEGNLDLALVFPADFENSILNPSPAALPNVEIYYNSVRETSASGYSVATALMQTQYNAPPFTLNAGDKDYNLASDEEITSKMLAMLVPMLMFALLASACMAVAPESIAGEKERGTMATMLITPIGRAELAIGKILSLTFFALLSGLSSFLGVILSLPKLTAGMVGAGAAAIYGVGDYFMLFGIIISVVLVMISAFSVMSALAKSVKEASMLITPLMMVIILLGLVSMFVKGSPALALFAIPLVGSGLAISGVMSLTANALAVALSIISNIVVAAVLIVLLAFMFRSEKIMFNK